MGSTAIAVPLRRPVIPDLAQVSSVVAREALDGILTAGWYEKRFGDVDVRSASTLAMLLRLYAHLGRPPTSAEIAHSMKASAVEVEQQLESLASHDLIVRDGAAVGGAYPFTEKATGHAVTFIGAARRLNMMCAIDALGVGAMCRQDVVVHSQCHQCRSPVIVRVVEDGATLADVHPRSAVVWTGFRQSRGCAANSLCTELVFFCSDAHLDEWRKAGSASDGRRLSMGEAFQVGKALFADRALLGG